MAAPIEGGRYLAEHIPGGRFVELAGDEHYPFVGDVDSVVDEIEEFLTGERPPHAIDRVLATVLFTDIVGSTERAAALGDRRWHDPIAAGAAALPLRGTRESPPLPLGECFPVARSSSAPFFVLASASSG